MPEIPTAVKPRLQAWWTTQDDGNHAIFEAIYLEAPAAVSRAISGGQWVADSAEPGLAAQLGDDPAGGGFASDQVPIAVVTNPVEVVPYHATINQAVTFNWTEENSSRADLPAYVTDVYVQDANGTTVQSFRMNNTPLAAGASAPRTWQFPGAPAAGEFTLLVYVNAEGVEHGQGVVGPQGYRTATMAQFGVGSDENQAQGQDQQTINAIVSALGNASRATPMSSAIPLLVEGLNWMGSLEQLPPEEHTEIQRILGELQQLPRYYLEQVDQEAPDGHPTPVAEAFLAKQHRLSGASNTTLSSANERFALMQAISAFTQTGN